MTTAGKRAWNKLSVSYAIVSISYTLWPNLVSDLDGVLKCAKTIKVKWCCTPILLQHKQKDRRNCWCIIFSRVCTSLRYLCQTVPAHVHALLTNDLGHRNRQMTLEPLSSMSHLYVNSAIKMFLLLSFALGQLSNFLECLYQFNPNVIIQSSL